jgi:uncharacterized RDD family membrane protein YckC
MPTGFDRIWSDSRLQEHWIRRLIAFVIDSVIVGLGILIIMAIASVIFVVLALTTGLSWGILNPFTFPFFTGLLSVLYFTLLEFSYGWTFGKKIMNLRISRSSGGRPSFDKVFIRNISKIYWILILLDVIVGLATTGDPNQKISDRYVETTVT